MIDNLNFVNLRVHSTFSLLESTINVDKILTLTAKNKQPAVGLIDTSNLFGILEFSIKSVIMGIQPIIGCKILIDMQDNLFEENKSWIIIIVCTEKGYTNLLKIINKTSILNENNLIKLSFIEKYSEGLIILTGGINGILWETYIKYGYEILIKRLIKINSIFNNQMYIEIQRNKIGKNEINDNFQNINNIIENILIKYANKNKIPVIATNETFFETPNDFEAFKILVSISKLKLANITSNNYFKSSEEMYNDFKDLPIALENTLMLAKKCNFILKKKPISLPLFLHNKKEENIEEKKLYYYSIIGLEYLFYKNGIKNKKIYYKRLLNELLIIKETNYSGYFLIVTDFIMWAKNNKVSIGPGRGSGASSLVAYSLGITNVDPIKSSLLFERFLNLKRITMPDLDIDFCQFGRNKVIKYVQNRYGKNTVGQIITFGTLQTKIAIKDIGRILKIPFKDINLICKLIPNKIEKNNLLPFLINHKKNPISKYETKKLLTIAVKLIGIYRHTSIHAAGLVIGNSSLLNKIPIIYDSNNEMITTQFNMNWVESSGLSKFDFLGLRTLSIIDKIIDKIKITKLNLFLSNFTKDKSTFNFITNQSTIGIFQLESQGMQKTLKNIKPTCLYELTALIALYRPGPIKNIFLYGLIKNKKIKRVFLHPYIDKYLDETYGIVVYQEQVMQIAQSLANYTLNEADVLRRAMSKKDKIEMSIQKKKFIKGALKKGIKENFSQNIFDILEKFADYGFNKSHAAAYSILSYKMGFLKNHFKLEFYAISMTLEMLDIDKINQLYYDAVKSGIRFKLPNVQIPCLNYKSGNFYIQFPLNSIKGLGKPIIDNIKIIKGKYRFLNFEDFCKKINPSLINKRLLKNLILSGSLDCFKINREELVKLIKPIMSYIKSEQNKNKSKGLFLENDFKLSKNNYKNNLDILFEEYQLLGCYVSENPIDRYIKINEKDRKIPSVIYGILVNKKKSQNINSEIIYILIYIDKFGKLDVINSSLNKDEFFNLKLGEIYKFYLYIYNKKYYCQNIIKIS